MRGFVEVNILILTLTLTSSSYYMSPLSLRAWFSQLTFCTMSCILYITLPRVRDLFLHWKSRFCWHWAGGGEGHETDSHAVRQRRHAIGR